jgi:uncharacterized membrane-anchored protein YhcB (DUF1043 family)
MKCEEVELKLIDYLDNNLDDRNRQEIEKHLETCEKCLDDLMATQQVFKLMSDGEMVKPDESLRINFYHMLHKQIKKEEDNKRTVKSGYQVSWYNRASYRIAAAIALLICGTFIGALFHAGINSSYASNEIKQLQSEVAALRKATMFTMLKDESSSDRIQAVGYAEQIDNPDENVIAVLVNTLNNDKNVNVRMAAAYALSKFSANRSASDSLVKSLSLQTDPILQITLINILSEKREKSAFRPVQEIIANKNTIKEVRAVAENSLRTLI